MYNQYETEKELIIALHKLIEDAGIVNKEEWEKFSLTFHYKNGHFAELSLVKI